jgi:hypothetical protein
MCAKRLSLRNDWLLVRHSFTSCLCKGLITSTIAIKGELLPACPSSAPKKIRLGNEYELGDGHHGEGHVLDRAWLISWALHRLIDV